MGEGRRLAGPALPPDLESAGPMRAAVEADVLVVGMTLVPHLYSRNRSFALFQDPQVRRARRRAAVLRGIVRQLLGGAARVERLVVTPGPADGANVELRYALPDLRVERRSSMSELELSCVRYLAGRGGVGGFGATGEDRARLDAALRRLAVGLGLTAIEAGKPA